MSFGIHNRSALIKDSAFALMLLISVGCNGDTMSAEKVKLPSIKDVPLTSWDKLGKLRIFFGHQSVGENILEGVGMIMKENSREIQINIVELKNDDALNGPGIFHKNIGRNDYPESKIEAFKKIMEEGLGDKVDIAFFKFCFWDIRSDSNVTDIFRRYQETLTSLKVKYPKTKFVHMTVPLMSYPEEVIVKAKRVLRMPVAEDIDNAKRNELNEMLLEEYGNDKAIFNVALVESTLPDGSPCYFSYDGKKVFVLAGQYTTDGGHLNDEGKRRIAEQFLLFLSDLAARNNKYK